MHKSPVNSQDFFLKYLPVLSPVIVIFTFAFNNWYDRRNKRREAKRSWYFKAYFEPNIKKIEDFFKTADEKLSEGKEMFNRNIIANNSHLNNNVIASCLYDLSNLKRKFSYEVLEIIRPAYPDEFAKMDEDLLDFEDAGTEVFGSPDQKISDQTYYIYLAKLANIKANLIQTLSGPALNLE